MTAPEIPLILLLVAIALAGLRALALAPEPDAEPLEPRVRRVLARRLRLRPERLVPAIRLADLGVRARDLVALAATLETCGGVVVPERLLRGARTYGDLVDQLAALATEPERGRHRTPVVRSKRLGTAA